MAAADAMPASQETKPLFEPLMAAADVVPVVQEVKQEMKEETKSLFLPLMDGGSILRLSNDNFNPKKHIDYEPPSKTWSMSDLKLPEGTGVSSFAVSEPFKLFTQEAVQRMRAEISQKEVWENHQFSSNLAQCQLRGYAAK